MYFITAGKWKFLKIDKKNVLFITLLRRSNVSLTYVCSSSYLEGHFMVCSISRKCKTLF